MKNIIAIISSLFVISGTTEIKPVVYTSTGQTVEVTAKKIFSIHPTQYIKNNKILSLLNNKESFKLDSLNSEMKVSDAYKRDSILNLAALINSECSICNDWERFVIAAVVVNRKNIFYKNAKSIKDAIFTYKQFSGTVKENNCRYLYKEKTNNPYLGKLFKFSPNEKINWKKKNYYKNILIAKAAIKSQNSNKPLIPKDLMYFFTESISTDKKFVSSHKEENKYPVKGYHSFYRMEQYKINYYLNKKTV